MTEGPISNRPSSAEGRGRDGLRKGDVGGAGEGSRSLFSSFSWSVAGNVIYSACQWGVIIILAKLVTTEIVGVYSLALAVTTPVIMLSQMNLKLVQATDADHRVAFNTYFSIRFFLTVLALAIIAIVSWVVGRGASAVLIIVMVGAAKAFESISDICYGLFMQHERMDVMGTSLVVRSVLSLALFFVLLYFLQSVPTGLLGLTLVWAIMLFSYDMRKARKLDRAQRSKTGVGDTESAVKADSFIPRWDLPAFNGVFFLSLPMGVASVLESLTVYIPRYAIAYFSGESQLGIFTALTYLLLAIGLVVYSVTFASVPRLAQHHARGEEREFGLLLLTVFVIISAVCVVMMLGVLLFGERLILFLYTDRYAQYSYLLAWLMGAGIFMFSGTVLNTALVAMRRFAVLMGVHLCGVACVSIASLLLIPSHGLIGAVWAVTISAAVILMIQVGVLVHLMRKRGPRAARHEKPR